eukprot:8956086-Heterocapsa_arctica.AAC.1
MGPTDCRGSGQRNPAAVNFDTSHMALQAMTCVALKERCKQLGCTVSGRKSELVALGFSERRT